jgi:hypothetical protein
VQFVAGDCSTAAVSAFVSREGEGWRCSALGPVWAVYWLLSALCVYVYWVVLYSVIVLWCCCCDSQAQQAQRCYSHQPSAHVLRLCYSITLVCSFLA